MINYLLDEVFSPFKLLRPERAESERSLISSLSSLPLSAWFSVFKTFRSPGICDKVSIKILPVPVALFKPEMLPPLILTNSAFWI